MKTNTQSGRNAINDMLESVMGRATTHAFLSTADIETSLCRALNALTSTGLPRSADVGVIVDIVSGEEVTNGYRGTPIRTRVRATRNRTGWDIDAVERYTGSVRLPIVTLTDEHRAAIVRGALRRASLRDSRTA